MSKPDLATIQAVPDPLFIHEDALKISTFQVLDETGNVIQGIHEPHLEKDVALRIYHTMQFVRVLDERMVAAQRQGRISFYMQCLGEEAAIIASAAGLSDTDMIMSQYREHGALAYRGFTLEEFMNQMFSNECDLGKGRQMPIHYGSQRCHFMTVSSPLATQIPQAAGYAYGQKLKGADACTLCYFGEGAASEGDFHAGMNMAAVLKTPTIFFCRNNGYAISTAADEQYVGDGIACRGVGYGMKTIRVDGFDALAVYEATRVAREHACQHNEPVLIEAIAYRVGAHSTSDDPSGYRTKDEEEKWQKMDPVKRFEDYLLQKGWINLSEEEKRIEALKKDVLQAVKKAEKIDKPDLDQLIEDVYQTPPKHLKQQLQHLKDHIKKYPQHYPTTASRLD